MTKKSETWKSDKTLDCESVSTKNFWYTRGEFKEVSKLPTPHIRSILEFMYKRADYKRGSAIEIMNSGVKHWKTPYYEHVAKLSIKCYCYEHFPAYVKIVNTLLERGHYANNCVSTPEKLGIQDKSSFLDKTKVQNQLMFDKDCGISEYFEKKRTYVTVDELEARLKKLEDVINNQTTQRNLA